MDMGGAASAAISEEQQLGQVVQAARKQAGLTQQGLCQRSGLSYSTLAKIERGAIKSPSIFTIQHIAGTLGISLDRLLDGVQSDKAAAPPTAIPKKVSKTGIRFVYFDMNGCLVRFASRGFTQLAENSGQSIDTIESIFWQYDAEVCNGRKSVDDLNRALSQRLGIAVDWQQYYLQSAEPMPGIDELVRWTGQNYHIGIMSNTMPGFIDALKQIQHLPNISYDAVIDSSVVHALKPEQAMYDIAVQQAGVQPEEILLVDDSRANLVAASRLGWKTVWFDSYHPEESIINIANALEPADNEPITQPETSSAQPVTAQV